MTGDAVAAAADVFDEFDWADEALFVDEEEFDDTVEEVESLLFFDAISPFLILLPL